MKRIVPQGFLCGVLEESHLCRPRAWPGDLKGGAQNRERLMLMKR